MCGATTTAGAIPGNPQFFFTTNHKKMDTLNYVITDRATLAKFCQVNDIAAKKAILPHLTTNDIIKELYEGDVEEKTGTRPKTWATFNQWKEKGYRVKKGEKAFRVWSRPNPVKSKDANGNPITETAADSAESEKHFFVACIFNEMQVEKIEL